MAAHINELYPASDPASGFDGNCRACLYAILLLPTPCMRCGCATQAAFFWVPPGHQLLQLGANPNEDCWQRSSECSLLHRVRWINTDARRFIARWLPGLRLDASNSNRPAYWLNHCEHCDAAVAALDQENHSLLAWWSNESNLQSCSVIPVNEQLFAFVEAFSIGDLADSVLESIEVAARCETSKPESFIEAPPKPVFAHG